MAIIRPDLAEEWSEKNILKPNDVPVNCTKMVLWKCKKCGFEWEAKIVVRNRYKITSKNGRASIRKYPAFCPSCVSTITKNKKLMQEWDYEKNSISPYFVGNKSLRVWWRCSICSFEWMDWVNNRINFPDSPCPKCNSLQTKFPHIAKEFSSKNDKKSDQISYGNAEYKCLWQCSICGNEWSATVSSRTSGGNGCPKCSKIKLKDGTLWDSKTEAYFYIQLLKSGKKFLHNEKYEGLKWSRYDFYIPEENKYIEVTAFHKNSRNVNYMKYLRNIVMKKRHVEINLGAIFEFVQIRLNKSQEKELNEWQ